MAGERRVARVRAQQRRGRREREGKKEKEGERGKEITPATTASGRARAPVGRDTRDEEEQGDGTVIRFGCRDRDWKGFRGIGELNDEPKF